MSLFAAYRSFGFDFARDLLRARSVSSCLKGQTKEGEALHGHRVARLPGGVEHLLIRCPSQLQRINDISAQVRAHVGIAAQRRPQPLLPVHE